MLCSLRFTVDHYYYYYLNVDSLLIIPSLTFNKGKEPIHGLASADYGCDCDRGRWIMSNVFQYANSPISCMSKLQPTAALCYQQVHKGNGGLQASKLVSRSNEQNGNKVQFMKLKSDNMGIMFGEESNSS